LNTTGEGPFDTQHLDVALAPRGGTPLALRAQRLARRLDRAQAQAAHLLAGRPREALPVEPLLAQADAVTLALRPVVRDTRRRSLRRRLSLLVARGGHTRGSDEDDDRNPVSQACGEGPHEHPRRIRTDAATRS
jgi:hypothetical protein